MAFSSPSPSNISMHIRIPNEHTSTKLQTIVLFLFASAQAVTMTMWMSQTILSRFDVPLYNLDTFPLVGIIQLHFLFILAFGARSYYIGRVWRLSRGNFWMLVAPTSFATASIVLDWYIASRVLSTRRYTTIYVLNTVIMISDFMAFVSDLVVALELCYLLHRRRSDVQATNNMINRILYSILHRGGINVVLNTLFLILLKVYPKSMLFLLVFHPTGQISAISVFTALLSRKSVQEKFYHEACCLQDVGYGTVVTRTNAALILDASIGRPIQVNVSRSVWKNSDGGNGKE
ncbi:hypothetical protein VKT23_013320 [Stygiomarasmius scandens]|uniref:DUF6534 domain-containing protein n=1 Tax=Marasmiellus scandens TaxID=2682957 RepID=A0ABR1J3P1_9AGAR